MGICSAVKNNNNRSEYGTDDNLELYNLKEERI